MDRVDEILDEMLGTIGQAADGWRQADILLRPFAERIATLESQLAAREGEVQPDDVEVSDDHWAVKQANKYLNHGEKLVWLAKRLDRVESALVQLAQVETIHHNDYATFDAAVKFIERTNGPLGELARQLASRAEEK